MYVRYRLLYGAWIKLLELGCAFYKEFHPCLFWSEVYKCHCSFSTLHPEYFSTDSRIESRYLIEQCKGCDLAKDCRYLNTD